MNKTELRKILLSNHSQLLITAEGHASAMMDAFPIAKVGARFLYPSPPTYAEQSHKELEATRHDLKALAELAQITLTMYS